jgi:cold shock CspA family protein
MIYQGTVVMYHPARFFGFIQEDGGNERFFHMSLAAKGFLPELGARVEYEIAPPIRLGKKDQAVNVRLAGGVQ